MIFYGHFHSYVTKLPEGKYMLRHIIYLIFFFNIIIWHLPKHIPKTQSFRLGFDFWAFYFGYNIPVIYIYIYMDPG